jgi:hypothetical protein
MFVIMAGPRIIVKAIYDIGPWSLIDSGILLDMNLKQI